MTTTAWSITQSGRYEPFDLQVARNQISWHKFNYQYGSNSNIGTGLTTIWAAGGTYAYPAAATVVTISSNNANDTSSGTGAQTVLIQGLDADFNQISETVSMNGLTPVSTTLSYLRINDMHVATAGNLGGAAGTLYAGVGVVTSGIPATIYSLMPVDYNSSNQALWTVPAGYTGYLTSCSWTSANTTANIVVTGSIFIRPYGGVFLAQSNCKMEAGNNYDRHFDIPIMIPEKSDIEMRASSSTAGSQVTGEFHVIYIKNDANG